MPGPRDNSSHPKCLASSHDRKLHRQVPPCVDAPFHAMRSCSDKIITEVRTTGLCVKGEANTDSRSVGGLSPELVAFASPLPNHLFLAVYQAIDTTCRGGAIGGRQILSRACAILIPDEPGAEGAGGCCQTNANRSPKSTINVNSGGEFTPFGQSRGSVLFECFSAVQMTFVAEVVVDG